MKKVKKEAKGILNIWSAYSWSELKEGTMALFPPHPLCPLWDPNSRNEEG